MNQKPSPNDQRGRVFVVLSLILGVASLLFCLSGWYSILGVIFGAIGLVLHWEARKKYLWLNLQKQGVFRVCLYICLCGVVLNSMILIAGVDWVNLL